MKAKVTKLEDEKQYNFRNDCFGKVYSVIKVTADLDLGDLYHLDTTTDLGCVTCWTKSHLQILV